MEKSTKNPFRPYLWLLFIVLVIFWVIQTLKTKYMGGKNPRLCVDGHLYRTAI